MDTTLDQTRALLLRARDDLTADPLRPQDAYELVADLMRLTPALVALLQRIHERTAAAAQIPGLYTTTPGADTRAELVEARGLLYDATLSINAATAALDQTHSILGTLGHSDHTSEPLTAVPEQPTAPPA